MSARIPLGDSDWHLWREVALRGAGFDAARLEGICDDELAAAADALLDGALDERNHYDKVFAAATERLRSAVGEVAADRLFREAVTWQNPELIAFCLDRAVAGETRNARGRYHELTICSYLQRYCLKNDTIGFFGPVGWATLDPQEEGISLEVDPAPLARRTTYFEYWAIDAMACSLAARNDVLPWLTPRVPRACAISGSTAHLPTATVGLTDPDLELLDRCDGTRTVRDLVGRPPDRQALRRLLRLRQLGVLTIDLSYDITRWPERGLIEQIEKIVDPTVRQRTLEPVRELIALRENVSAAAGDPDRLLQASTALARSFERHTEAAATRHAGAMYTGRTLVYEDTVRSGRVTLGRVVTDALAGPLTPLLDSASWLVNQVAERYRAASLLVVDRAAAVSGRSGVPLVDLLALVMPEAMTPATDPRSPILDAVVGDFQQRWSRILAVPPGVRRHQVRLDAVVEGVAREFPGGPPPWCSARRHAPDIMLAASGPDAIALGDFQFVLGELHVASTTLENRLWTAQHPDVARLRSAAEEDGLDGRVVLIPSRKSAGTTSRLARPGALMLPSFTYVTIGDEVVAVPPGAEVLPAGDLLAARRGTDLVVRRRSGGPEYPFLEVVGDLVALYLINAFRPFAPAAHRPRVSVDRLVMARESWTFTATDIRWAFVKDERERYAAARHWAAGHGLPERVFVVVPVERKPIAIDLRSLPLVNLFAKAVRRTSQTAAATFSLSEALPDVDELWLQDAEGRRYTSELRFIAVAG